MLAIINRNGKNEKCEAKVPEIVCLGESKDKNAWNV